MPADAPTALSGRGDIPLADYLGGSRVIFDPADAALPTISSAYGWRMLRAHSKLPHSRTKT